LSASVILVEQLLSIFWERLKFCDRPSYDVARAKQLKILIDLFEACDFELVANLFLLYERHHFT